MINEALKKHSTPQSDPEARKGTEAHPQERFFWKQVTNSATLFALSDYLQRYPAGEFADQARHRIDDLTRQGASGNASTNATDH